MRPPVIRVGPELAGTWYLAMFDNRDVKEPVDVWQVRLIGNDNLSGRFTSSGGVPGHLAGYMRGETLTLAFRSEDARRLGYGSFILEKVNLSAASATPFYAGAVIAHDCVEGGVCKNTFRRVICPAILSKDPEPRKELKDQYFVKACGQVQVEWPKH